MPDKWKNRIVGYKNVPIDQIKFNDLNWRVHPQSQQTTLSDVISSVGIVQNVIINRMTGNLVDGHLRVMLADRNGEETVPATIIDVSREDERIILATLDPISAMATTDRDVLKELLIDIDTDSPAIMELLGDMVDSGKLDADELESVSGLLDPVYQYTIIFDDLEQLQEWNKFLRFIKNDYNTLANEIISRVRRWLNDN